jgi:hypothetical protein
MKKPIYRIKYAYYVALRQITDAPSFPAGKRKVDSFCKLRNVIRIIKSGPMERHCGHRVWRIARLSTSQ